ncbi:PSD1 and planctomycete cytochrome C domain-containing protein [Telluribacter sp. SYSU D00476]|uniref:PSD1 and planctomycete cytochrome C domain-containing protein n=1 Tax=Telluribacter sp. SYSU D00476 TaxID=2811430 RepID=UPI00286D9672|nr:PSD1 and planctomycete cytochrome C domain-containing protein [Telluribacter sp. SYSU D00476]
MTLSAWQWWGGNKVDFNTQIRPILNANCTGCHGGVKQQGNISLLYREKALSKGKSGKPCIVPGRPKESELIARLKSTDPDDRMPLKAPPLSEEQISLLERWIEEGAEWETHWSYIAPEPQKPPLVLSFWPENDIDKFVYKKLKEEGLSPAEEANKAVLLRRVTLDLTGLAPTPQEYDAFLNDKSENAYEKVVDRLLSSPHYGERWAAMWLDLARYGDSQGYQKDRHREIWQYRDWVIDAFNKDMPFDQFTVEQLAGDLLPNPTVDQRIATAFHRNTNTNDEGGTDDEEFRVVAVIDRVNTTMEVWQGTTMACVQCHSHPYDPFPHKDYYQLMAFFNTSADADRTSDVPLLSELSGIQKRQMAELTRFLHAQKDTADQKYIEAHRRLEKIKPSRTPVMEELPADSSRKTYVFERGNWMVHGEEVRPQTPKTLTQLAKDHPASRMGLAKWLVSPQNPLTARVMVNRYWEQLFGRGLVETLEDFGTQGAKPVHPELLDWLALRFMNEDQWSVKKLLREIVLSATYRQSSEVSEEALEKDPYNTLLSRGPRVRLTAEQVRDQALAASGLLSPKLFGPSVMPPQPDGVWQVIRNVMRWRTAEDEDRHRRALYTYWRKSSPYPSFTTFDAPSRELCLSRRVRTNTPLQALVTLNDPVYLEASQGLAWQMKQATGYNPVENIKMGYKRLTGHMPSEERLRLLLNYYQLSIQHYRTNSHDVLKFLTMDYPKTPHLAALSATANVMLNLDEVITKQ